MSTINLPSSQFPEWVLRQVSDCAVRCTVARASTFKTVSLETLLLLALVLPNTIGSSTIWQLSMNRSILPGRLQACIASTSLQPALVLRLGLLWLWVIDPAMLAILTKWLLSLLWVLLRLTLLIGRVWPRVMVVSVVIPFCNLCSMLKYQYPVANHHPYPTMWLSLESTNASMYSFAIIDIGTIQ